MASSLRIPLDSVRCQVGLALEESALSVCVFTENSKYMVSVFKMERKFGKVSVFIYRTKEIAKEMHLLVSN